jgi:hypothetical protein
MSRDAIGLFLKSISRANQRLAQPRFAGWPSAHLQVSSR